jgi:hypothetical protein
MTELRAAVLRGGGTVHAVHAGVRALTVQVRAADVLALAQRRDVASVSPNRVTQRTASTLEAITGTLTSNVRTGNIKSNAAALDGSGIGIAVLDSGVMRAHHAFAEGSGSRVRRNVDIRNAGAASWATAPAARRRSCQERGARCIRGACRQRRQSDPGPLRAWHTRRLGRRRQREVVRIDDSPTRPALRRERASTTSRCSTTPAQAP